MPKSLILINEQTDKLWRQYLPNDQPQTMVIDPAGHPNVPGWPYRYDLIGQRRWLRRQNIDRIHCYQPITAAYATLAAAVMLDIQTTIHLTGNIEDKARRALKLLARKSVSFSCAGNFIAGQLRQLGIDTNRISVNVPEVKITTAKDGKTRLRKLRRQIGGSGAILLALPAANEWKLLKNVFWAAAILKHFFDDLTVVVTGPCRPADRRHIFHRQKMWDCQGMIYIDIDDNAANWDELLGVCDVVVSGHTHLVDVIRLLHARAAGARIIAATGQCNEFLADYEHGHIVTPASPRQLAGTILPLLNQGHKLLF
jgi:hypothetical protein